MENFITLAQIIVAVSVYYVWIFRYFNVIKEFNQFGLSDVIRNFVGASKISLSALLLTGVWFSDLVFIAAAGMAFFMICAQFFHFKAKNPFMQRLPSLLLLLLCVFIVMASSGKI